MDWNSIKSFLRDLRQHPVATTFVALALVAVLLVWVFGSSWLAEKARQWAQVPEPPPISALPPDGSTAAPGPLAPGPRPLGDEILEPGAQPESLGTDDEGNGSRSTIEERHTIREARAQDIVAILEGVAKNNQDTRSAQNLFLYRWTPEPGWDCYVIELPKWNGDSWEIKLEAASIPGDVAPPPVVVAWTDTNLSDVRLRDSVQVSGRITQVTDMLLDIDKSTPHKPEVRRRFLFFLDPAEVRPLPAP